MTGDVWSGDQTAYWTWVETGFDSFQISAQNENKHGGWQVTFCVMRKKFPRNHTCSTFSTPVWTVLSQTRHGWFDIAQLQKIEEKSVKLFCFIGYQWQRNWKLLVELKIKRDTKASMELEDTHKPDHEILILNHSQNDTVCYPLVLIEGVISNNVETAGPRRLLQMSSSVISKNLESDQERNNKVQILHSTSIKNTSQVQEDEWT